jgi:hypothetical protein
MNCPYFPMMNSGRIALEKAMALFRVGPFPPGAFVQRMDIFQEPFVEAQFGENVGFRFAHEYLILQAKSPDARFARVGLDAEEHAFLQGDNGIGRKIGHPGGYPGIDPAPWPPDKPSELGFPMGEFRCLPLLNL